MAYFCTDWSVKKAARMLAMRFLQADDDGFAVDLEEEWPSEDPLPLIKPESVKVVQAPVRALSANSNNWNTSNCKAGYMIWLSILLIVHSLIDAYIFFKIVKPKLEPLVNKDAPTAPPKATNAPATQDPGNGPDMQPSGKGPQTAYQDPGLAHDMN